MALKGRLSKLADEVDSGLQPQQTTAVIYYPTADSTSVTCQQHSREKDTLFVLKTEQN